MSDELLRDVLRTGDAAGRTRRRWFLFPMSLVVHAVGALAYLIVPLAAEVTLPTPAPPFASRQWRMPVAPPTPTVTHPRASLHTPTPGGAPTTAPEKISPEIPDIPHAPAPGAMEGPPGAGVDLPDALSVAGPIAPPPAPPKPEPVDRRPLKIGGTIRAPQRLAGSPPVYPQMAIAARIQGEVRLEALIDERGQVRDVRILKSVPLLDGAAVDAVRTWRYTPTLLNGVPVSVLMTVTVSFNLQR